MGQDLSDLKMEGYSINKSSKTQNIKKLLF